MSDVNAITARLRAACPDIDTTVGGALGTLLSAAAAEIAAAEERVVQLIAQLDPATCTYDHLVAIGRLHGIYPRAARGAEIEIILQGIIRTRPQIGDTVYLSSARAAAIVTAAEGVMIRVRTQDVGVAAAAIVASIDNGDRDVAWDNTTTTAVGLTIITRPAGAETTDEFRRRLLLTSNLAPFAGSPVWASAVIAEYDPAIIYTIDTPYIPTGGLSAATIYTAVRAANGYAAPRPVQKSSAETIADRLAETSPLGVTWTIKYPRILYAGDVRAVSSTGIINATEIIKTMQDYCIARLGQAINLYDLEAYCLSHLYDAGYLSITITHPSGARIIAPPKGAWIVPCAENTKVE